MKQYTQVPLNIIIFIEYEASAGLNLAQKSDGVISVYNNIQIIL